MLSLEGYKQSNGFSVMEADELYYVNGGSVSVSFSGITITSGNFSLNVTGNLKPSVTITATWHF